MCRGVVSNALSPDWSTAPHGCGTNGHVKLGGVAQVKQQQATTFTSSVNNSVCTREWQNQRLSERTGFVAAHSREDEVSAAGSCRRSTLSTTCINPCLLLYRS